MAAAVCITDCFDSQKARRYYPGDQDDIDLKSPVAKHFKFAGKEEVPPEPAKREIRPTADSVIGLSKPKEEINGVKRGPGRPRNPSE